MDGFTGGRSRSLRARRVLFIPGLAIAGRSGTGGTGSRRICRIVSGSGEDYRRIMTRSPSEERSYRSEMVGSSQVLALPKTSSIFFRIRVIFWQSVSRGVRRVPGFMGWCRQCMEQDQDPACLNRYEGRVKVFLPAGYRKEGTIRQGPANQRFPGRTGTSGTWPEFNPVPKVSERTREYVQTQWIGDRRHNF